MKTKNLFTPEQNPETNFLSNLENSAFHQHQMLCVRGGNDENDEDDEDDKDTSDEDNGRTSDIQEDLFV